MARPDLLALDPDALAVLANRGIVKRAQSEVESLTCEVSETDGTVTVRWSDDVECVIPAGKGLADGRCTCPATTLCRHLVRSVFAYQRQAAGGAPAAPAPGPADTDPSPPEAAPAEPAPAEPTTGPWDPGTISDEELERHYRKLELTNARKRLEEGHVVELLRSAKPSAYFHTLSLNVRFLVPGSLAYTHCDCAEARPCSHVPLAIWAFRMLPPDREGGLVSTHREHPSVPAALLDDVEANLLELLESGIQGVPRAWLDRARRLEARCREGGLVWPAEILAELVQQQEAYWSHDARFSPARVAELLGELCIRMDAVRSDTGAVPQLFIRGSSLDRVTDVGRAQMVGLGCRAHLRRNGAELSVYLQDDRSGSVVVMSRDFPDPAPDSGSEPRDFPQLARTNLLTGVSLGALGCGRLQIEGGKRTPSGQFLPGRARATLNPHAFQWEKLIRAPILADSFTELAARLAAQPPAALRPRRLGARLHVCPVAGVEGVHFSQRDQALYALLTDAEGGQALLVHPYTSRSRAGTDLLLHRLAEEPETLRFVAAEVSLMGSALRLQPLSLVFEKNGARSQLQPWIDAGGSAPDLSGSEAFPGAPADPIAHYPAELLEALGEQALLGLHRADSRSAGMWSDLARRGAALGFHRLVQPAETIAGALEQKSHSAAWEPRPTAQKLLELAVLALLAGERVG